MHTLPSQLLTLQQNLQEQNNKEAAWTIIHEYFKMFSKEDIQQELWHMLSGSLTNDTIPQLQKGENRYDLIFFYEFTLMFMEAVGRIKEG